MSILSELSPYVGSAHRRKILGRGDSSGRGGTSTKGHKGQKARSGGKVRWGFEGGQMPLMRRSPKFGFNNTNFETKVLAINLDRLSAEVTQIDLAEMVASGQIHKNFKLKVVGNKVPAGLKLVSVNQVSKGAMESLSKAGVVVTIV
jgi:large subunit ribosomal protein L15